MFLNILNWVQLKFTSTVLTTSTPYSLQVPPLNTLTYIQWLVEDLLTRENDWLMVLMTDST